MHKILKAFRDPKWFITAIVNKYPSLFSDKLFLKLQYWILFEKKLNLKNPKSFNEKIQWLKLYDRKEEFTKMVDKIAAKDFVSSIIGNEYIIPTIGVWDNFDAIDFNELPNQFVLKCNHDSGGIVICNDKSKLNLTKAKNTLTESLKRNFYNKFREYSYKNIKPKIIAEELLSDNETNDLLDYKFMVFNGKVKCSFVCSNRDSKEGLHVTFYDLDWNKMPFERLYPSSELAIPKPINYELMITLSEKIANAIPSPFVRIDFYNLKGKIFFGEITFYPGSGFEAFQPEKWDEEIGNWLVLPNK